MLKLTNRIKPVLFHRNNDFPTSTALGYLHQIFTPKVYHGFLTIPSTFHTYTQDVGYTKCAMRKFTSLAISASQ
jgi:hypothetical protein